MKKYLVYIILGFFTAKSHSAALYDLICKVPDYKEASLLQKFSFLFSSKELNEYKYITISKGLREGHTKSTSKNNQSPREIYFDLNSGKFISSSDKEESYLDLAYFTSGAITLPICRGSIVETKKSGFID